MKIIISFLIVTTLMLISQSGFCNQETKQVEIVVDNFKNRKPEIPLFQSVEIIKNYVENNLVIERNMSLQSVTMAFIETHPKKGLCWQYHWSEMGVISGGDFSIFHYMDGEIIYFPHGP